MHTFGRVDDKLIGPIEHIMHVESAIRNKIICQALYLIIWTLWTVLDAYCIL